jgi:hypothetical protein
MGKTRIRDPGSGINIPDPQHWSYTYVIDLSMAYADYVAFCCGPLRRMGFEDDYLRVFKKILGCVLLAQMGSV